MGEHSQVFKKHGACIESEKSGARATSTHGQQQAIAGASEQRERPFMLDLRHVSHVKARLC
ncbi:MAG: hypothetical protein ACRD4F_07080, partial [Candidatus Angelobacter sp.]